jgi:hypothetical protein
MPSAVLGVISSGVDALALMPSFRYIGVDALSAVLGVISPGVGALLPPYWRYFTWH